MIPMSVKRSLVRAVDKEAVRREYTASSREATPYARAKWSSEASMLGRFRFGLARMAEHPVRRWLDIGCGEADFFALAEQQGRRFERLTGVDITPAMIELARQRHFDSPAEFKVADFETMNLEPGSFDFISMVGVLQQCGVSLERAFGILADLLAPGGFLYLTTKHLGWRRFTSGELVPEPNHSWYDSDELRAAATGSGLEISCMNGLNPGPACEIPLEKAHTMYLLAVRRMP